MKLVIYNKSIFKDHGYWCTRYNDSEPQCWTIMHESFWEAFKSFIINLFDVLDND